MRIPMYKELVCSYLQKVQLTHHLGDLWFCPCRSQSMTPVQENSITISVLFHLHARHKIRINNTTEFVRVLSFLPSPQRTSVLTSPQITKVLTPNVDFVYHHQPHPQNHIQGDNKKALGCKTAFDIMFYDIYNISIFLSCMTVHILYLTNIILKGHITYAINFIKGHILNHWSRCLPWCETPGSHPFHRCN